MSRISLAAAVFTCLWLAGSQSCRGQINAPQQPPPGLPRPGATTAAPPDATDARFQHKMEAQQVSERFKHIQQDTRTLLQLATELQAAVDKTDREEMSLDVIKKAEQIEKLARSVKDRMRQQ